LQDPLESGNTLQPSLDRFVSRPDMTKARPFLKWAGGKSRLLPEILNLVPKTYERYIEPFLGGAALFFELNSSRAILSDANRELIICYKVVRDNPEELLQLLRSMSTTRKTFYEIRRLRPEKLTKIQRAARLIYLNKTCYNGVYRVNRKGEFNTPYGKYRKVRFDEQNIRIVSQALRKAELIAGDFEPILLKLAEAGDFVYLDPPYPPLGGYSDFKRYVKDFFEVKDHVRLAKVVYELDRRSCKFVLSNAKHPLVLQLYSRFTIKEVKAPRFVSCRGDRRGNVPELLIANA